MPPPSSTHHRHRHHHHHHHHHRRALRFPAAPTIARYRHLASLHRSHLLARLPAPDISTLPYFSRLHAAAAALLGGSRCALRGAVTPLGQRDGGGDFDRWAGLAPSLRRRERERGEAGVGRAGRLACTEGGSPVRMAGAGADGDGDGDGAEVGMLIGGEEGEEVYRRVWGRRTRGQREVWRKGEGYLLASREWVGVRLAWEEDGADGGEAGDSVEFTKRDVGERRERVIWEDDTRQVRKKMGSWWIADDNSGDEAEEVARKRGGEPMGVESGEESDDQIGADSRTAVESVLPPRKEEATWPDVKSQFDHNWHTPAKTTRGAAAASPSTPAKARKRSVSENWEAYPQTPSGRTEYEYEPNEKFYGTLLSPLTSDIGSLEQREEDHESPISSPKHDQQSQPLGGGAAATQLHQAHGHDPNPLDSTLQTIVNKNRYDTRKQRRYTLDPSPNRAAARTSTKHFKRTDVTAADSTASPTTLAIRAGELPLSDSFQIDLRHDSQTDPFTEKETVGDGPGCSTDEMDEMLTSIWNAYVCGNEHTRGRLVTCLREALDEQARLSLDNSG